jgi:hypothetical protein
MALLCEDVIVCAQEFPDKKEIKKNMRTCFLNEIMSKFNPKFLIEYYIDENFRNNSRTLCFYPFPGKTVNSDPWKINVAKGL